MFKLVVVPVFRTGLLLALPGLTIEIAPECSGIRPSLALLITSLLAGHLFLRAPWAKAALVLATFPLLWPLSIYLDPGYLSSSLRQGSIVFFTLTLVLLASVLCCCKRSRQTRVDVHA